MVDGDLALTDRASYDLRRAMVDNQVRTFDVTDQRVLEVMYMLPREKFVPSSLVHLAYSDAQISLEGAGGKEGRVLLPPMFLAKLIQNSPIDTSSRVLLVGAETGYAAAVLAPLCASVVALESDEGFAAIARTQLAALGLTSVDVVTGPLAAGHPKGAPYDIIFVNGAVETGLEPLFDQLAQGGSLMTIDAKSSTATRRSGKATRFDKRGTDISPRALFDATTPVLPEFRATPTFHF